MTPKEQRVLTNVAQEMAELERKDPIPSLIEEQIHLEKLLEHIRSEIEEKTGYRVYADTICIIILDKEHMWAYHRESQTSMAETREDAKPIDFVPGVVQNIIQAYKDVIAKETTC